MTHELFTVFHNHLFTALCRIISDIEQGKSYTADDIRRSLSGGMAFHPVMDDMIRDMMVLFFDTSETYAKNHFAAPLPPALISTAAKEWLHTLLADGRFSFLLPAAMRDALSAYVRDASPLPPAADAAPFIPTGMAAPPLSSHEEAILLQFHEALLLQQQLTCTIEKGTPLEASPVRLSYDAANHAFTLILYDAGADSFLSLSPQSVVSLSLLTRAVIPSLEERFDAFLRAHRRTVTLLVSKKWNAVERCFLLFAAYDKEAIYNEVDETYRLTIDYDDLHEDEVLQHIYSLGSAVTVLAPSHMRQRIVERLRASYQYYS